VAMRELRELRALAPVFPGDTVRVRVEVAECGPARRPQHGQITLAYTVLNQKDEEVMRFRMVVLAHRAQPLTGASGATGEKEDADA
jgi:3-hydroxybutyryl-CoA dehydratase